MTIRRRAAVVTLAGATSLAMGLPLLMLSTVEEVTSTPTPTPTPTPTLEQLQDLADREDRLLDMERMSVDEARAAWREGAR